MFFVGLANATSGVLLVFASQTDRTPALLQAIVSPSMIPMTVGVRWLLLHKLIAWKQGVCF
jgi:hypothetical protein